MAEKNKIIIEEYIFNGSPDDFKRLYLGDEAYKFFQEINDRKGGRIDYWEPFTFKRPPVGGMGADFEWRIITISDNRSKLVVRVFGSSDSWNAFRSDLEQQGLIIPIDNVLEKVLQLIPKKEKTLKLYREAWQIWLVMNFEYDEDVLDGRSKKPKPTMEDYRARVISEMDWQVNIRTLSTIKRLGNLNLFD